MFIMKKIFNFILLFLLCGTLHSYANIQKEHIITAKNTDTIYVTVQETYNGTVSLSKQQAKYGDIIILEATPNTNYDFICWIINNIYQDEDGNYLYTENPQFIQVFQNTTITPVFRKKVPVDVTNTSNEENKNNKKTNHAIKVVDKYGNLLILKDGIYYNALGTIVE